MLELVNDIYPTAIKLDSIALNLCQFTFVDVLVVVAMCCLCSHIYAFMHIDLWSNIICLCMCDFTHKCHYTSSQFITERCYRFMRLVYNLFLSFPFPTSRLLNPKILVGKSPNRKTISLVTCLITWSCITRVVNVWKLGCTLMWCGLVVMGH